MDENLTEQQQIESLKKLWKEYGFSIVLGALIAIGISFGWHFYQDYKTQKAERASVIYERMMIDVVNNEWKDVANQTQILLHRYASTPYASIAALTLAKHAMEQQNISKATKRLQWVVDHGSSSTFQQIARIRLARIYISQNKPESALKLLDSVKQKAFLGLVEKAQGDAYLKLKKPAQAKRFYQSALMHLPPTANMRALVQMQLNDLPQ